MKKLSAVLFATVLLIAAGTVRAATVNISWTAPITRENGSALAPAEILMYVVNWTCTGSGAGSQWIKPSLNPFAITADFVGTCDFSMTTYDKKFVRSKPSNVVELQF